MKNDDGSWSKNQNSLRNSAITFYSKLLSSDIPIAKISSLDIIPNLISFDDNDDISRIPTEEEITKCMMEMNKDSTSGPDGFFTLFFQKCLYFIKYDVINAIHDFFDGNMIPKIFSTTSLALIPKKINPKTWNDFRPISLCSTFYKLIARMLALRLSEILPKDYIP